MSTHTVQLERLFSPFFPYDLGVFFSCLLRLTIFILSKNSFANQCFNSDLTLVSVSNCPFHSREFKPCCIILQDSQELELGDIIFSLKFAFHYTLGCKQASVTQQLKQFHHTGTRAKYCTKFSNYVFVIFAAAKLGEGKLGSIENSLSKQTSEPWDILFMASKFPSASHNYNKDNLIDKKVIPGKLIYMVKVLIVSEMYITRL